MTAPTPGRGHRRHRPGRRLWAAAILAVAGLTLGGCASARNDLGTRDSSCYLAIPTAAAAVHHRGQLHGVLLASTASLRTRDGRLYREARAHGQRNVCLVAFTGHFQAGSVAHPLGHRASGDVAIVELGYPDHRLLGTVLATRQTLPFGHSHILPL